MSQINSVKVAPHRLRLGLWLLGLLGLRLLLRLLLRRLRLLKGRLRLLGLWLLRQRWCRSTAESRACTAAAHIASAGINRPREMVRQAQPAGRNYDEKLGILKRVAF